MVVLTQSLDRISNLAFEGRFFFALVGLLVWLGSFSNLVGGLGCVCDHLGFLCSGA